MHRFVALVLAVAALAVGCAGGSSTASPEAEATAQPEVRDIDNVLTLRAAFNADRGKPRLLLLLSPT